MNKHLETDKQFPLPEREPSGSNHPFVKGKSLKPQSSISMSVENGTRDVEIIPSLDPEKNFTAIDKTTGEEVKLTNETDITTATNLIRSNPFSRK